MRCRLLAPGYLALLLSIGLLIACGGESSVDELVATAVPQAAGELSMGGGALGGNAETTALAQQVLEQVPEGDLAWVAHESRLAQGESIEHTHDFAFVYTREGTHLLGEDSELEAGEGAAVTSGTKHRHGAVSGSSVFWEVRLAAPGSGPAPDVPDARLVFESEPLADVPDSPLAVFALVLVPVGGRTSVHTHPGPEFIYQLSGRIDYENAIIGTIEMGPGDIEGIPPVVPVQKRNPYDMDAEFLSWFLVDRGQPFASPAGFESPEASGENLAVSATVVDVSSNYGSGTLDSSFGANKAVDDDPATEWSSDGDGDGAWIEIELPGETHVTSLGFWTRTMGHPLRYSPSA